MRYAFPGTPLERIALDSAIRANVGACICPHPGDRGGICSADLAAERLWDSMGAVRSTAASLVRMRHERLLGEMREG